MTAPTLFVIAFGIVVGVLWLIGLRRPTDSLDETWRADLASLKSKGAFDRREAEQLLRHPNPNARSAASVRLGELGDSSATTPLVAALVASRKKNRSGDDHREHAVQLDIVNTSWR